MNIPKFQNEFYLDPFQGFISKTTVLFKLGEK